MSATRIIQRGAHRFSHKRGTIDLGGGWHRDKYYGVCSCGWNSSDAVPNGYVTIAYARRAHRRHVQSERERSRALRQL